MFQVHVTYIHLILLLLQSPHITLIKYSSKRALEDSQHWLGKYIDITIDF